MYKSSNGGTTFTNVFNVAGVNSRYTDPYGTFQTSQEYIPPRQVHRTSKIGSPPIMPMTITEKILARASGQVTMKPGDLAIVD